MNLKKHRQLVIGLVVLAATTVATGGSPVARAHHSSAPTVPTIYAWGNNNAGQLGDGTTANSSVPVAVSGLPDGDPVTALAAGNVHSMALTTSGVVYAWGLNNRGQLGNGTTLNSSVPVAVSGLPHGDPVTAFAAAGDHSMALTTSGAVYAWGANDRGQLGDGTTTDSSLPVAVSGLPYGDPVTAIAAGWYHSLALTSSGTVYAWGTNYHGQLGIGAIPSSNLPVPVSGLPGDDPVTAIAAGGTFSMALTRGSVRYAWGSDWNGELGDGTATTYRFVPIMTSGFGFDPVAVLGAGGAHSLAILDTGRVLAWGLNQFGQLGNGTTTDHHVPGYVLGLPDPKYDRNDRVMAVAGGVAHSLALTVGGAVYAWGWNESGQLGTGSTSDSNLAVQVHYYLRLGPVVAIAAGGYHSLALMSDQ